MEKCKTTTTKKKKRQQQETFIRIGFIQHIQTYINQERKEKKQKVHKSPQSTVGHDKLVFPHGGGVCNV